MASNNVVETVTGDLDITGSIDITGTALQLSGGASLEGATGFVPRATLKSEKLAEYPILFTDLRYLGALLPNSETSGRLTMNTGTWASGGSAMSLQSVVATGTDSLEVASASFAVPPEYVDGGSIVVRMHASASAATNPQSTDNYLSLSCTISAIDYSGTSTAVFAKESRIVDSTEVEPFDYTIGSTGLASISKGTDLLITITVETYDENADLDRYVSIYGISVLMDIEG